MCTLIILNEVHAKYPLVIAANRDEYYSRGSLPPRGFGKDHLRQAETHQNNQASKSTC